MRYLRGPLPTSADPATDLALAHALLRRASRGEISATLRVYRPSGHVVAFGRRDTNRRGFADAAAACRDAGFTPVVRASGGRAVAHTRAALVVDHVSPDPLSPTGMDARFVEFGELFVEALRGLGIDARVGEVPGEYCPGAHSVNARGTTKLVGTAQRLVRNGWLFSSVLIVDGAAVLRPLLSSVYDALELPFDPASVGAAREERPDLTLDTVELAVQEAYASRFELEPAGIDADTLAEARSMVADHRVR